MQFALQPLNPPFHLRRSCPRGDLVRPRPLQRRTQLRARARRLALHRLEHRELGPVSTHLARSQALFRRICDEPLECGEVEPEHAALVRARHERGRDGLRSVRAAPDAAVRMLVLLGHLGQGHALLRAQLAERVLRDGERERTRTRTLKLIAAWNETNSMAAASPAKWSLPAYSSRPFSCARASAASQCAPARRLRSRRA
eukprot:6194712-Pleurochrysis_carterae.AAC.2